MNLRHCNLRHLSRSAAVVAITVLIALLPSPARAQRANPPLIFAAASLQTALDAIAVDWRKDTGKSVKISYASSSALARQIEQGAPADIFFAADLDWMDWLQERNLVRASSREVLLGNSLVLVAPIDGLVTLKIAPGLDLGEAIGPTRLSVTELKSTPAGRYTKAALENLGMWAKVENRLAQSDTVRAALAFVARGEARLGIVYATDARAEPRVKVVGTFPASSHPAILYPIALTASSNNPEAAAFVGYLKSPPAAQRFAEQGFSVLER